MWTHAWLEQRNQVRRSWFQARRIKIGQRIASGTMTEPAGQRPIVLPTITPLRAAHFRSFAMKMLRSFVASAAIVAFAVGSVAPAFAQHGHGIRAKRPVAARTVAEPVPSGYVAQVRSPGEAAAPLVVGTAVGVGTGVLVANSTDVASALGAGATVGAGFGFGAIGGVGALILYCAIAKPHQECF
jgi:hypothetical protein